MSQDCSKEKMEKDLNKEKSNEIDLSVSLLESQNAVMKNESSMDDNSDTGAAITNHNLSLIHI